TGIILHQFRGGNLPPGGTFLYHESIQIPSGGRNSSRHACWSCSNNYGIVKFIFHFSLLIFPLFPYFTRIMRYWKILWFCSVIYPSLLISYRVYHSNARSLHIQSSTLLCTCLSGYSME